MFMAKIGEIFKTSFEFFLRDENRNNAENGTCDLKILFSERIIYVVKLLKFSFSFVVENKLFINFQALF